MSTLSKRVTICNSKGLHARSAAKFVNCAANFDCRIKVNCGEKEADGTSLIQLMLLSASVGSELTITSQGNQSSAALEALCSLVINGFGESSSLPP